MTFTTEQSLDNSLDRQCRKQASLREYVSSPCFANVPDYWIVDDPFCRPVRSQDIQRCKLLDSPLALGKEQYRSAKALLAHRILLNVYEQDLMFLPATNLDWQAYQEFYSSNRRRNGEFIRPDLEETLFGFLDCEIAIGGGWQLSAFHEYCDRVIHDVANTESTVLQIIANSPNSEAAAKFFLIQSASDYLSEASAMARNCTGSYGCHISELFKILIDEYGYGVHCAKHSQAYVDLMNSLGLKSSVHYYWQFYTASSLSLVNYFHYLCKNHGNFFKYLGALYYTEATLSYVTKNQMNMLKGIFSDNVNTFYFEEHAHIDKHHGRMAYANLIRPIVEQYGEKVIPQILAGFTEFKFMQELADEDLCQQIRFNTDLAHWKSVGTEKWKNADHQLEEGLILKETLNEISIPHCHDTDELLVVLDGTLEFISNPLCPMTLSEGEAIAIPKYMHHGSRVLSQSCTYKVIVLE